MGARWGARIGAAALALSCGAGAGYACAPTPLAAARGYIEARARCDFVAAWSLLAPSERQAALDDLPGWTQLEADAATERLRCRNTVEGFELAEGGGPTDDRAVVRYVAAVPVIVQEFQRLLSDRERADVLDWRRLDAAIFDARIRILQSNTWEPRARIALTIQAVRTNGAWCVDARIAALAAWEKERASVYQREAAVAAERRRTEEEKVAAARMRAEVALPGVSIGNLRRGRSDTGGDAIFAEVVNGSAETLTEVEIRVEYIDRTGAVAGEVTFKPIVGSLGQAPMQRRQHYPLPPGQRRPFGMHADQAPSNWVSQPRVTVIRVEVDASGSPAPSAASPAAAPSAAPVGARRANGAAPR